MKDYGGVKQCVNKLLARQEPGLLVPQSIWNDQLQRQIHDLGPGKDPSTLALKSALLLWNDDLDGCHKIAQDLDDTHGAYLHAIMHRREPDYENSKYWFRRVPTHALFRDLRIAALELLQDAPTLTDHRRAIENKPDWDPLRMVDWCEEAAEEREVAFLRALQAIEIQGLAYYWMDKSLFARP